MDSTLSNILQLDCFYFFIRLSPWISAKHFATPRLLRASDGVIFLTSCSSSANLSSGILIKTVSSDCKIFFWFDCHGFFSAFLSPIYVYWIKTWLWCKCLSINVDIFIKCDFIGNFCRPVLKFRVNLDKCKCLSNLTNAPMLKW